jgi:hypothetical protein
MAFLQHVIGRWTWFIVMSAAVLVTVSVTGTQAQNIATNYTFSQSTGNTYTPITGGSVWGTINNDDEDWPNVPIGFSFNFNGTVYTQVSIQTNGYIVMGPTIGGYNYANPICCGSNDNLISALFLDLQGQTNSEIMSKTEGTAPNRVFVVQWKNYRNYGATLGIDNFNFQIRLNENSLNSIEILYGTMTNGSNYTHLNPPPVTVILDPPVGLRGVGNADYNIRKAGSTTSAWAASIAGTTVNDVCEFTSTFGPPSGLKYKWDLTTIPPPPPVRHWVTIAHPIGSITPTSPATLISFPVYYTWWSSKSEAVYRDFEFTLGGWSGGPGLITAIGWTVGQTSTFQNGNLYVYLANVGNVGVVSGPETPDNTMTLVYSGASPAFSTIGWKDFTLQTPFLYTGGGLLVKVTHDGTNWSTTAYFQATNTGTSPYLHRYNYNDVPASSLTTLPYLYTYRPDVRMDICIDPNPTTVDFTVPASVNIPATIPLTYSISDKDDSYSMNLTFNFRTTTGSLAYTQSTTVSVTAGVPLTGTVNLPSSALSPGYYIVETIFNVKDYCAGMKDVVVKKVIMVLGPGQIPCLVWPGDVNNDGTVDYGDRSGLNKYIQTANLSPLWLGGPPRYRVDAATNPMTYYTWEAQASLPWQTTNGCYMDADGNGTVNSLDYIAVRVNWLRTHGTSTPKQSDGSVPLAFGMSQNYPNPFGAAVKTTRIDCSLPEVSEVTLTVTDLAGKKVATLTSGQLTAGIHSFSFDGSTLNAGLYIATITAQGGSGMTFKKSIKMSLTK